MITCTWCGNEEATAGQPCMECKLPADSTVLSNINQIRAYAVVQGYKRPSYDKIQRALNEHALPVRKGGGWTKGTLDSWLSASCSRTVVSDSSMDRPANVPADDTGAAAARAAEDAMLKRVQRERMQFKFDLDRGKYTETETIHRELGDRARAFRIGLESFGPDMSEQIAAIWGGEGDSARQLLQMLGVEDSKIALVIEWAQGRGPQFMRLWQETVEDFLDAYATGHWWTDAMREAWERFEAGQKEEE